MSDAYSFVKRRRVGNASAKLVLYAIAEYANESGVSQPSSARLREDTELSQRTISTSLELLEERQIIKRERSRTEKGRRAPDRIILIGYREWLRQLRANSAPSEPRGKQQIHVKEPQVSDLHMQIPHVQELHMQDLHITPEPQDVGASAPADTSSQHANSARAIRQEESNTSTVVESLFYVENAVPKRRSSALKTEAKRVSEELWFTWPAVARKRHTKQQVTEAVEAVLSNVKLNARGSDLIAAGKRHVAERQASGAHFVKGLVPFLTKGLWQNWASEDEPSDVNVVTDAEWRRRVANYEHDGAWLSSYGPRPGQSGYVGPQLAGSR